MCKWVCHLLHQPTPSHPWVSRRWGPISTALTRRAGQRVQPTRCNKFHSTANLFPTPQYVHCFLFLKWANSWVYAELKRARQLLGNGARKVQGDFWNGTLFWWQFTDVSEKSTSLKLQANKLHKWDFLAVWR